MEKVEVVPVPPEFVDKFWKSVCTTLRKIPNYDMNRTHQRLLTGLDQLWVACAPSRWDPDVYVCGVVITTISDRPPSPFKVFQRDDPAKMRSLKIHIAGEYFLPYWLDSAVERITLYARENHCRQLFVMMRKRWQCHIVRRFWSREWEGVAISRDRPTKSTCKEYRSRNTPGHFRRMVPVKNFNRHMYRYVRTFYFQDTEAA